MRKRLPVYTFCRRSAVTASIVVASLLGSTVASSAPAARVPDSIVDNETVYVVADATGTPRTTVVVDWLQVQGTGSFAIADPAARADEIESLTEGFACEKSGDTVNATVDVDGYGDFFYRAETTAELPLDVKVSYWLDDEEIAPEELAGKSGRLRIQIALFNHLERTETITYENADGTLESSEVTYTVPLLCIPQLEIDGTRMTDIVPPEGAQLAIAGQTLTYAVPMVPSPDATAVIEMYARDIELAPMIVSAFPTLPASPDFSVTEDFIGLRDGLSQLRQLSEGHLQVVRGISDGMSSYDLSGASGVAEGLAQLQAALGEMETGASGLAQLSAGQHAYLDGVIAGIDASQFESLADLVAAISAMREAAADLDAGVTGLLELVDGQILLVGQMDVLNDAALANAETLKERYPGDAEAIALVDQLTAQAALFDQLLDSEAAPGLPFLRAQLAATSGGLAGLLTGLEELETQSADLNGVPAAFAQLKGALVVLRDGGDPDGAGPAPSMPGLGTTRDGLAGLASGLGQARGGLSGSSSQLAMLAELPAMMGDLQDVLGALASGGTLQGENLPGIDTTVDALGQTADGLGEGVAQMRKGEALTNAMKESADSYTSFLGLPEGATGHLSFLYKVDGVSL
ncbi:MAG: hypothetical protein JXA36_04785 [Coriobacteriia bacterium]|nr:hypothetical protein [Coriobacteriia bacterium]